MKETIFKARIKREFLLDIVRGVKKHEYRDVTDFYTERLCTFDKQGECTGLKKIDEIYLYTGEKTGCDFVHVQVTDFYVVEYVTKKGLRPGRNIGDIEFIFDLGKIIKTNVKL